MLKIHTDYNDCRWPTTVPVTLPGYVTPWLLCDHSVCPNMTLLGCWQNLTGFLLTERKRRTEESQNLGPQAAHSRPAATADKCRRMTQITHFLRFDPGLRITRETSVKDVLWTRCECDSVNYRKQMLPIKRQVWQTKKSSVNKALSL